MDERKMIHFSKRMLILGKYIIFGLCLFLGLSLAGGCFSKTVPKDEQRNLTPYSLHGNNADWEISCVVRELTTNEKKEQLRELEKNWKAEEALLLSQEGGQKIYEQTKEQHELMRQELKEKKAYVSIISGVCRNREVWGKTFDYQLKGENNKKIISGTQTVSSDVGQWYRSWQTEAQTQYGLFIPPSEKAEMVIHIGDKEMIVPLERSTNTEIIIK